MQQLLEDKFIRVVAIDGPANSGKGTVASAVSKRLGFSYLDTGIIYRSLAYLIASKIDFSQLSDDFELEKLAVQIALSGEVEGMAEKFSMMPEDERNLLIRTEKISALSSQIATIESVRTPLTKMQRMFAVNSLKTHKGTILDGRDIGTAVFPDAICKIFLTASPIVRAKRRFLASSEQITLDQALDEIKSRDDKDQRRELSPLVCDDSYHVIDTSELSKQESIECVINVIVSSFKSKGLELQDF